ncbi:protocadherin fat 4, partial [Plakobranchus ocellatus]
MRILKTTYSLFLCAIWISFVYGQTSPTCTNSFITISVTEPSMGGAVLRDFATNPDCTAAATLTYTILSGDSNNRFAIVGTEFQVGASPLDAEANDGAGNYESPYKIIVEATNADSLSAYLTLLVQVQSDNDNDPVITPSSSTVSFTESTALGTSIASCALTDADFPGGLDATVNVAITAGNEGGNFAIDSSTCDIILIKALDFDTNSTYNLTLEATDLDPSTPRTTSDVITVNVDDENDVTPTCPFYNTIVEVDENTNGVITTLMCSDIDALPIVYTKISGDSSLTVDTSGVISISAPGPDYESGDRTLVIAVLITDQGLPLLSTSVTYSISVVDLDDNVPVFSSNTYTATVSESANLGDIVLTVAATDGDVANTDNSQITFGFETACSEDWFALDSSSGDLLLKTAPVFATAPSVTCEVFAYSSNLTSAKDLANITITIEETNVAPVFTQTLYEATLSESDSIGTAVLTVIANDTNSGTGGNIVYSLETVSPFTVDSSTGEVTTDEDLNYETATRHLVLVRATDQGNPAMSAEAYLSIAIEPVNEFDPAITPVADQTVAETATPGTTITTVVASDSDAGSDGEIEFTLEDPTLPFILEAETGVLRSGLGLDREMQSSYDVVVVATDRSETTSRSSSTTVSITVSDVNDNAPDCNVLGPILVTPSNTAIGNPIGQLTCSDGDSSTSLQFTETAGDTNNIFQIDPNNGEIRLQTAFVYGTYSYLVTVSDSGAPARTTLVPVEILVEADLSFDGLPDTTSIAEDFPLADIVYNVSAVGAYDLITYSIVSGNGAGKFSIHPSLGQVRLVSALDRESVDNYVLTIRATTTNAQTLDETLTIVVADVNDNIPQYANSFTNISFVENVGIPLTLQSLPATDSDQGLNALIDYAIVSGNTGNVFTYDANGDFILSSPVDYETTQYFELVLTATDRGSPPLTGTTVVYVTVQNLNDNVLTLTPAGGEVSVTLPEDTAVGDTVVQVAADDADIGTELSYGFLFGNDFEYLSINPNTGAVFLAKPLDRETISTLTVGVEINSTQGESATATVTITVSDVNDNDPSFSLGNYAFEVPNNTTSGTDVGALTASDSDATSPNNDVTLSIESGDTNSRFSFNGQTLQAADTLLAATDNLYNLVVIAVDGGNPARTSTAYVTVHVADEFKTPSFVPSSASISVEETRVPGSIIFDSDATAAGAQEEPTGDLQYSISSGNDEGKFFVEEYTGAVQLLDYLSFATTSSYTLVILAVNKNVPNTLSALFTLSISVTQVNKHDPVFTLDTYSWSVSEDAAIGTQVGTLSADDADLGAFGTVSYALESNSTFAIDSSTGVVTLTSALEYSQAKSYNMFVTASDDAGNSSRTATAAVVISVTDVNNHDPVFSGTPYSVTLPETLTTGSGFLVLKAADLDSGAFGTVTYSIVDGNADGRFSIGSSTGALSLAAALDYETVTQHTLTIHASDGGNPSRTGTATVTINVSDENDNAPDFGATRLELRVGSDLAPLSAVSTITATDSDSAGTDGEFNYVIESGNDAGLFSIDTVTGEIKTTQALDSATGFYTLEVIAVDQGLRSLTGTVTVGISVQLVTSPATGDYSFTVSENEAAGEDVGTIPNNPALTITSYMITLLVTSPATGDYSFTVSENEAAGEDVGTIPNNPALTITSYMITFSISATAAMEGLIETTKSLDREEYAYYQLQVDVNHSTGVQSLTVIVQVTDRNDNTPRATSDPITITMVENLPVGTVIGTVEATDEDETGINSQLSFAMASATPLGPVFFAVDSTTGALSIAKEISYEVFDFFRFRVRVADNANSPRTGTATIEVTVVDVDETVTFIEMPTVSFVPVEFPFDLGHNEVAYTLSPSDFGVTTAFGDVVTYLTIDYGVFNVDSSTGAMSLYLPERVQETTSIKQWVVMTVKSGVSTSSYSGLVRLDTFNKDKHLIALLADTDATDLASQQSTLQTHLNTFFTSPNLIKVWRTEATTQALARRRLLAQESVALALVLQDSATDTFDQIDQFKTYLTQEAALSPLRTSSDGTPASNVSGQPVLVSSVLAFVSGERPIDDTDGGGDSLNSAVIALIIVAAIAAVTAIVGLLVLAYYCCTCCERRR